MPKNKKNRAPKFADLRKQAASSPIAQKPPGETSEKKQSEKRQTVKTYSPRLKWHETPLEDRLEFRQGRFKAPIAGSAVAHGCDGVHLLRAWRKNIQNPLAAFWGTYDDGTPLFSAPWEALGISHEHAHAAQCDRDMGLLLSEASGMGDLIESSPYALNRQDVFDIVVNINAEKKAETSRYASARFVVASEAAAHAVKMVLAKINHLRKLGNLPPVPKMRQPLISDELENKLRAVGSPDDNLMDLVRMSALILISESSQYLLRSYIRLLNIPCKGIGFDTEADKGQPFVMMQSYQESLEYVIHRLFSPIDASEAGGAEKGDLLFTMDGIDTAFLLKPAIVDVWNGLQIWRIVFNSLCEFV